MTHIKFPNWSDYQHYKDRDPPWIKLHFSLLSSRHWHKLDDDGKLLALVCLLLASRNGGIVECDAAYIKGVGGIARKPDFAALVACGLCVACDDAGNDASATLADCKQDASNLLQRYVSLSVSPSVKEEEAEKIYAEYPRKVAKKSALKAIAAAIKTNTAEHLMDRVKAYAAAVALWPESEKKFVPHPATWFNRGSYDDDPATWVREGYAKPKTLRQEDLI